MYNNKNIQVEKFYGNVFDIKKYAEKSAIKESDDNSLIVRT